MTEEKHDFQLVPPHIYRHNSSKRAIQTLKKNLIIGLCISDKNVPLHLWDILCAQCDLTLNLLCQIRINPNLSAWEQPKGNLDFNGTQLASPGTLTIIHEKTHQRKTWDPHHVEELYLSIDFLHHQCYRVWIKNTRTRTCKRHCWFFPHPEPKCFLHFQWTRPWFQHYNWLHH